MRYVDSHCSLGTMMSEKKSVLKGGTQCDVRPKTFTRTIRSFDISQLQLGLYVSY